MGSERGSVKGSKGRIPVGHATRDAPNEREEGERERERNALRDAPRVRDEIGTPCQTLRE